MFLFGCFVTVCLYLQTTGKNADSLVLEGEITEPEEFSTMEGGRIGKNSYSFVAFFQLFSCNFPFSFTL